MKVNITTRMGAGQDFSQEEFENCAASVDEDGALVITRFERESEDHMVTFRVFQPGEWFAFAVQKEEGEE